MQILIFWPNEHMMTDAGFRDIARVPAIFDENWKYQAEASWYLRDRFRGEAFGDKESGRYPTRQSLETFARALCDFLEWCDWAQRPWQEVEYTNDLINGYQKHMEAGTWSANHRSLAASTINSRIDEACYFLKWSVQKALRPPFKAKTRTVSRIVGGISVRSHTPQEIVTRIGKVRADPMELNIPSADEIVKWLKCVKLEKGQTKALMCELIVKSAIRREECAQWRMWTLPLSRGEWSIYGQQVTVKIEYGAKGPKRLGQHGVEIGPSRFVVIPLDLAERIHFYREFIRPKIRMNYVNAAVDSTERRKRLRQVEHRLFISEHDGEPITGKQLWKAWTEVNIKPYSGWSPHLGRHYWSCRTLLDSFREREKLLANGVVITGDWIAGNAQSDLLTIIQPQLGHIDTQTTNIYLRWLQKMALGDKHDDQWIDHLENLDVSREASHD
ncbi:MAG: site-specific integrase [Methyloglobulus sp.]|nr:site-specific integrase [Methyloglobulus sp.]